ncbi:MAG TPA: Mur ligase family protein, partial [Hanamia sp.]|nr:Mur ligase family protein [Hanamia sp.]
MKIDEIYEIYKRFPNVQTDSRKLRKGEIFFALKGPNFNGNQFTKSALELGASYVVADEFQFEDERIILVEDALNALQQLAKFHREQFDIPFIAITGSNGKTTTKELIHEVLATSYKTYTTVGNLNNQIGIPLTILKIKRDAEMAVIEMGANHLHEIASYCEYAKPGFGLITNIGKAHLEGFGGAENVKKGKGELFDYLRLHGGTAFVNTDDPAVFDLGKKLENAIYYGSIGGNIKGQILETDPFLKIKIKGKSSFTIQSQLVGNYNLP